LVIGSIIYFSYLGYKFGLSEQLYEVIKVFTGIAFADKFGVNFSMFLIKHHILLPENFASLKLIGFLLLFSLYFITIIGIEKLYGMYIKNRFKIVNRIFGSVTNGLWVLFIWTFGLFIVSQFRVGNIQIKNYLHKSSIVYPYMHKFCKRVVTNNFVKKLTSGSVTDTKEIFLETISDEKTYKELLK